jgi:hypothetical protein
MMKTPLIITLLLGLLAACNKPHPPTGSVPPNSNPALLYTNFNDREIKFGDYFSADLDKNGTDDFSAGTLLLNDPLAHQDYRQYLLQSKRFAHLPINSEEQAPVLHKGDKIYEGAFAGYHWSDVAAVVMAQKVIGYTEMHWEGLWKGASHRYLPIRLVVESKNYYGWVEVSFSTHNEKMILHRAAVSRQPEVSVQTD